MKKKIIVPLLFVFMSFISVFFISAGVLTGDEDVGVIKVSITQPNILQSIIGLFSITPDTAVGEVGEKTRRMNCNFRYRPKKIPQLNFGVNGKVEHLTNGGLIALDGGVLHELEALEDSIVRLSLSKKDDLERVKRIKTS